MLIQDLSKSYIDVSGIRYPSIMLHRSLNSTDSNNFQLYPQAVNAEKHIH